MGGGSMNRASGLRIRGFSLSKKVRHRAVNCGGSTRIWGAWIVLSPLTASLPALAQQKTGPGITGEDSLTWHGITLYGVIDIGVQYDTHSAPFTPYRPAASGNIVRQNSRGPVIGLTPSNM